MTPPTTVERLRSADEPALSHMMMAWLERCWSDFAVMRNVSDWTAPLCDSFPTIILWHIDAGAGAVHPITINLDSIGVDRRARL